MSQLKTTLTTIIALAIFLCSCNAQEKKQLYFNGLDVLLERYYSVNYDYPKTKKEFVYFCEHDTYLKGRLTDTLGRILNSIEDERVNWRLDDTKFPSQELIVFSGKDTIVNKSNNWRFPCIGYYNDAFVDCYLREPSSIYEFLLFCDHCDSTIDNSFWPFQTCDSITIMNLRRCSELPSLEWIQDPENLYLIINKDTLWHHSSTSPCRRTDKTRTFSPHYYNQYYHFVTVSEEVDRSFRLGLRNLSKQYLMDEIIISNKIQILEFDSIDGLQPLCDENFNPNEKWFLALTNYLGVFANENGFKRIVFSIPIVEP